MPSVQSSSSAWPRVTAMPDAPPRRRAGDGVEVDDRRRSRRGRSRSSPSVGRHRRPAPLRDGEPRPRSRPAASAVERRRQVAGSSWLPPNASVFDDEVAAEGVWRCDRRGWLDRGREHREQATTAVPTTSAVAVAAVRRGLRHRVRAGEARRTDRRRPGPGCRTRPSPAAPPPAPTSSVRRRGADPRPPPPHRAAAVRCGHDRAPRRRRAPSSRAGDDRRGRRHDRPRRRAEPPRAGSPTGPDRWRLAATTVTTTPTARSRSRVVRSTVERRRPGCTAECAEQRLQAVRPQPKPATTTDRRRDDTDDRVPRAAPSRAPGDATHRRARRSANSRVRWATTIENVLSIVNVATTSAIAGEHHAGTY